jgi:hypothetical protein
MNAHSSPLPHLRIDTTHLNEGQFQDISLSSRTPSAGVLSFPLDPGSLNTAKISQNSVPFPSQDEVPSNHNTDRALRESRKLLAHLLRQLRRRPMPPPVFQELNNSIGDSRQQYSGALLDTVGTGKIRAVRLDTKANSAGEDEEEEESRDIYTTDVTYDLMFQLKEILGVFCLSTFHKKI